MPTPENKKYETPDQFEAQTGYKPTAEIWKPISVTPIMLQELRAELATLPQEEKARRTAAFIEANKAPEGNSVAPLAAAVTAGSLGPIVAGAIADTVRDTKKDLKKDVGLMGILFSDPKDIDPQVFVDHIKDLYKQYTEATGLVGFISRLFINLKLRILVSKMEKAGIDFSKYFSPEEMLFAGLASPQSPGTEKVSRTDGNPAESDNTIKNKIADEAYKATISHLIIGQDPVKYSNYLSAIAGGIIDATVGATEQKKKDAVQKLSVNVMSMESFRQKSYADILSMGETGIRAQIKDEKPELADAVAKLIFRMLTDNTEFFGRVFAQTDTGWKNKSIDYLVSQLYYQHGYRSLVDIGNSLRSHDFTNIESFAQLPREFFGGIDKTSNPPKFSGILGGRFEELKAQGLSIGLAQDILMQSSIGDSTLDNTSSILQGRYSNREKSFLKKLIDPTVFIDSFRSSLRDKYGLNDALLGALAPTSLTLKDAFELYAIMKGNADVTTLKEGEKGMLLLKLQFLFAKNDIGAYSAFIAEAAKSPEKYQTILSATQILNTTINKGAYVAGLKTTEGVKALLNAILEPMGIDTTGEKIAVALGVSAGTLALIVGAFAVFPAGLAFAALTALFAALGWGLVALAQKFIATK